jgi:hypothetical protein
VREGARALRRPDLPGASPPAGRREPHENKPSPSGGTVHLHVDGQDGRAAAGQDQCTIPPTRTGSAPTGRGGDRLEFSTQSHDEADVFSDPRIADARSASAVDVARETADADGADALVALEDGDAAEEEREERSKPARSTGSRDLAASSGVQRRCAPLWACAARLRVSGAAPSIVAAR